MCLLIAKKESFLWNRYINGELIIWLLRCTKTFPGLYIIEIYLKKSRNDYRQKCKQPKFLLRASFLHTKKYLLFYFYPTQPRPQIFSPRKGEEPWGQGCINFGHWSWISWFIYRSQNNSNHLNTSRLGSSRFISATFHLSLGEYL